MEEKAKKKGADIPVNITVLMKELLNSESDACINHSLFDINRSLNTIRLRDGLINRVLRNEDYSDCLYSLYYIVGELAKNPDVLQYFPARLIEDLFREYLIDELYHTCRKVEITERIQFLYKYLQGYHHIIDCKKKSLYFSVIENIKHAENNEEPLPPIKRLDMFTDFLVSRDTLKQAQATQ